MTQLSHRIARLSASPIRAILSEIDRPGMISFAGGLPADSTFKPVDLGEFLPSQLQYGATEGEPALRQAVATELVKRGLQVDANRVLILSGSQQGIDLMAKLVIDNGTHVAVESPTYLAALQVFSLFGASYKPFYADSINELQADAAPAMTYVVPTFQNPTGRCYSDKQRRALAAYCDTTGSILFEDDPYRDLCFDQCDRTPICASVKNTEWVYQGSFSKTFSPALRLGYLACSERLYQPLSYLKQAADLHSNRLSQHLVLNHLNDTERQTRLEGVVNEYRQKRDRFDSLLCEYFTDLATWHTPAGGLFFWLTLKHQVDTQQLFQTALAENVAFMPGDAFYCDKSLREPCIRLNFSHAGAEQAKAGLSVLSNLIRTFRYD